MGTNEVGKIGPVIIPPERRPPAISLDGKEEIRFEGGAKGEPPLLKVQQSSKCSL